MDSVDTLHQKVAAALAEWLLHVGCPVAAHVHTRGLDDHVVVFMARPWEAPEEARRRFAEEACGGYDSSGQFSPGWATLYYGEDAVELADDADADPGFCEDDEGVIQRQWATGATRLSLQPPPQ